MLKKTLFVGAAMAAGITFFPSQADAFVLTSTITGDARPTVPLDMAAKITILQGTDADPDLGQNQAKWIVELLNQGSVANETTKGNLNVGFDQFAFNVADRIAGFLSFTPITTGWTFSGNGTSNQALSGSGNMRFDYRFNAPSGNARSKLLEFILTYNDNNVATTDVLFTSDFTQAPFSTGADPLSGQAGGHVIGFANAGAPSGIVTGKVPTPALLPGLIGMGVAVLRKRQQEDGEQEA